MWDVVSNVAAIVAIILVLELLGLPGWIRGLFGRKDRKETPGTRLDDLESRVRELERRMK